MINRMLIFRRSLVVKLIFTVGLTLLLTISAWAYFNIKNQKAKLMDNIVLGTDRLTNTIKLGTHYAMMLNSRDDINQIINNIGKNPEIENIRIYNKAGQIKFSNWAAEIDQLTNIKAEACDICHRTEPPLVNLNLNQRTRIFTSAEGYRLLGIIDPIVNEPGCATDACHVHPVDKKILGALDVVVSLAATDKEIIAAQRQIIGLAVIVFLVTSTIIFLFVLTFVNRPIRRLVEDTRHIAKGEYEKTVAINQDDELGQLSTAITKMGRDIEEHEAELNRQRDEYQDLFERVPCLITVQDKNYRLVNYNREFAEKFAPNPGDYCYQAYKGLDSKCKDCPVEKTFKDGQSYISEESGPDKDGTLVHWFVRTSPIKNARGDVVAAMEMSLDITPRKQLEEQLEHSEKKYHAIFNNIPNPVFVLDLETLEIRDCNDIVATVYGYRKEEIISCSFLDLFRPEDIQEMDNRLKTTNMINQARQVHKDGTIIYVDIWVSPSQYPGSNVLLVTTSDITQRLEAEQQLIQASKMATLGEMATGVAHELNQPLSVIKTVSSFCMKKFGQQEPIEADILQNMLTKVDGNVDRASRIITHMRQFARKSDLDLTRVQLNDIITSAFEIFSQQLKVRGIEVEWHLDDHLPKISADPSRLEQVFINLLINARDAIEEKWQSSVPVAGVDKITIVTRVSGQQVVAEVCDTGIGIPPEIADKLFEPFFTTKEVGKGTGLGLSISYGIVKDCGGQIEAVSPDGNGACFHLIFNVAGKTDAAPPNAAVPA